MAKHDNTLKRLIGDLEILGDENRLRIMALLKEYKEICVCEIYEALDLPQNLVSYHLGKLKDAGFVEARKQGAKVIYSSKRHRIRALREHIDNLIIN